MLEIEERDGDLSLVHDVLVKARQIGLCTTCLPDDPGYDFGVWGKASQEKDPTVSLAVLEEVAKGCAGVAACIHSEGLGAQEGATQATTCAVAFFEPEWDFDFSVLQSPPPAALKSEIRNDNIISLTGIKDFVLRTGDCSGTVVYAANGNNWQPVYVPDESAGLVITPYEKTMGLAALQVARMEFDHVEVPAGNLLPPRSPDIFLRRHLLGMSAIALGNAKGAWESAKEYALDRYQGRRMIDEHDAVRILLGDACSRIYCCDGFLYRTAEQDRDDASSLRRAIAARLRIALECGKAVTDCLQVLGGYGYMEDYRLEKRLRDALTIKSMSFKPDRLRALCFTAQKEGAR